MTQDPAMTWRCRDTVLTINGQPLIMGILNVTPDSFSDGGRWQGTDAAVAHGLAMLEQGADIIDIGGESTRPGAAAVAVDEELARVVPVIERLSREPGAVLSVDTMKAEVAQQAVAAGAHIINDVSALRHDPDMAATACRTGAGVVLMHMRGNPRTMQDDPQYDDAVKEVAAHLGSRLSDLVACGLDRQAMAVDPGIGFGKSVQHNVELLAGLNALAAHRRPIVVGLSRKSFLGRLTGRPVDERLAGSLAGLVFCVLHGAHILRVHDVAASRDAVQVASALQRQKEGTATDVETR